MIIKYVWKCPYVCAYPCVSLPVLCLSVLLCLLSLYWLSSLLQHSALSPSDRLALCQERMIVFESCKDVKHGRSPTRGQVNNKLATSPKVRGNMTSRSASLIGSCRVMREWISPVLMVWIIVKSTLLQGETCALSQFHDPYEH